MLNLNKVGQCMKRERERLIANLILIQEIKVSSWIENFAAKYKWRNTSAWGSGFGSVGRAVASNARGPRFKYSQLYWKGKNKDKEARNDPFKNSTAFLIATLQPAVRVKVSCCCWCLWCRWIRQAQRDTRRHFTKSPKMFLAFLTTFNLDTAVLLIGQSPSSFCLFSPFYTTIGK